MSAGAPFAVLHVCMGNICRSPTAELLLRRRGLEYGLGEESLYSYSAGTGSWHVGQAMNDGAARQLRRMGVEPEGHRAQQLDRQLVETADLILTATEEQSEHIGEAWPDASSRTFLLRHFGLTAAEASAELPAADSPEGIAARGVELVRAVDAMRARRPAEPVDDPWGGSAEMYARVAEEIDVAATATARALAGR